MNKTLPALMALCAALLATTLSRAPIGAALAQTAAPAPQSARVIVKFKEGAVLLRKRALSVRDQHAVQAQTLGLRHGLALRAGAAVHDRAHVVFANGLSSEQLAARLAQDAEIEYAVPDRRKRRTAVPNDPLYLTVPGNGPASGQWYLRAPAGEVQSAINAEAAWDVTTGSSNIVVAVLDSGVRFEHPDLKTVASGGNFLPGYDMISDVPVANDNNGRDSDPSDPGDWLTLAEVTTPGGPFDQCSFRAEDSSWHGTQVAGLIGALTNNSLGMASVGRNVRVLPVRVLGKCGGFDSDIVAGMRWAAGLDVPGVPPNPIANRAKVINLSLGGAGACDSLYQEAVNEITAAGVTIVASAGNSTGHVVSSPANCNGVIGVAALRHFGTKVGFSDLGPEISISAPGGNCVLEGVNDPCVYPILTTSNSGRTTPDASSYTDSFNISIGTSFAAPIVAGTAALLLSVQPSATPSEVRTILRSTARLFPTSGADAGSGPEVVQCVAPNGQDQLQCYCTTSTCGAGMLDAGAAVQLARVLPRISITPANPLPGVALTLSGAGSLVAAGRSIASYQWTIENGGGIVSGFTANNGSAASITPSAAGQFSVSLTVTDDQGAAATTTVDIIVPTGIVVGISASPSSPQAGQTVTLSAAATAASGRSIAGYQWSITNSGGIVTAFNGATNVATASITPLAAGQFSVRLIVTDSFGSQESSTTTIAVSAPPPSGGGGGGALHGGWVAALLCAVAALRPRRGANQTRR